jgi:hypothetical protein
LRSEQSTENAKKLLARRLGGAIGSKFVPEKRGKPVLVMGFQFKSLGLLTGMKKASKPGVGCLRHFVPSKYTPVTKVFLEMKISNKTLGNTLV